MIRSLDYYDGLMPQYTIQGSYKIAVFYQTPVGQATSGHVGHALYRDPADPRGATGMWSHTRYGEAFDADPNPPTSPNPDKQGRGMLFVESQSDWAQHGSKRYNSAEEERAAGRAYSINTLALQSTYRNYSRQMTNLFVDVVEADLNSVLDYTEDEWTERLGRRYTQETIDNMDDLDRQIAKDTLRTVTISEADFASFDPLKDHQETLLTPLRERAKFIERISRSPEGTEEKQDILFSGDARVFSALDAFAMTRLNEENIEITIFSGERTYSVWHLHARKC